MDNRIAMLTLSLVAAAMAIDASAAEVDMAGSAHITYSDLQREHSEFHYKGVIEGTAGRISRVRPETGA